MKTLFGSAKIHSLNLEILREAGFEIIQHLVKLDKDILDFLSLVFNLSKERLVPSNSNAALTR